MPDIDLVGLRGSGGILERLAHETADELSDLDNYRDRYRLIREVIGEVVASYRARAEKAEAEVERRLTERLREALTAWRHSPSLPDCLACSVLDARLQEAAKALKG